MTSSTSAEWVAVARLMRPQGRRGELLAEPLTDLPGIFAAGAAGVLSPTATAPSPSAPAIQIEDHWFPTGKNAGRVVLKLSGCHSISSAETLAGQHLLLPATALPTLDPDTFFVGDLLGCAFFDGHQRIGTIVDVQFATSPDGRTRLEDAAPLLGIALDTTSSASQSPDVPIEAAAHEEREDAEEDEPILIPFVRAWLEVVDIPGRRVVMRLPPGLIADPQDETPS